MKALSVRGTLLFPILACPLFRMSSRTDFRFGKLMARLQSVNGMYQVRFNPNVFFTKQKIKSHSPPGHIGLHHPHHFDRGLVNFDKGPTEDLPQPQHLDHLHHFGTDTFNPKRKGPLFMICNSYRQIASFQVNISKTRKGCYGNTNSLMRTAKASLFLAGGRGGGGLCSVLRMRVSSRCALWLSFKKSSKRLNFSGLPLDTWRIKRMHTSVHISGFICTTSSTVLSFQIT